MKTGKLAINSFKDIIEKGYKYFIFDCDGVIWFENIIYKEAISTIEKLINNKNKVFFLSNNNRISREKFYDKIIKAGIKEIGLSAVYPASYLTAKFIKQNYQSVKSVYLLGSIDLQKEIEYAGIEVHGGVADKDKQYTFENIKNIDLNPNIDAAVCGSDDYINYYKITYATNIAHQTKLLFGTNYDNNWKTNIIIPGAYTYISSIETASEVKATIAAKPNKEALKIIFRDNNLDHEDPSIKSKILMIGDSLRTDIKFAQNCGIDSCLVLTGMIKYEELNDKLITCTPTYIVEDLKI